LSRENCINAGEYKKQQFQKTGIRIIVVCGNKTTKAYARKEKDIRMKVELYSLLSVLELSTFSQIPT
jgi:hypothetical protein